MGSIHDYRIGGIGTCYVDYSSCVSNYTENLLFCKVIRFYFYILGFWDNMHCYNYLQLRETKSKYILNLVKLREKDLFNLKVDSHNKQVFGWKYDWYFKDKS